MIPFYSLVPVFGISISEQPKIYFNHRNTLISLLSNTLFVTANCLLSRFGISIRSFPPRLYLCFRSWQLTMINSFINLPANHRPSFTLCVLVTIVATVLAPAEPPLTFHASLTRLRFIVRSISCSLGRHQ